MLVAFALVGMARRAAKKICASLPGAQLAAPTGVHGRPVVDAGFYQYVPPAWPEDNPLYRSLAWHGLLGISKGHSGQQALPPQ